MQRKGLFVYFFMLNELYAKYFMRVWGGGRCAAPTNVLMLHNRVEGGIPRVCVFSQTQVAAYVCYFMCFFLFALSLALRNKTIMKTCVFHGAQRAWVCKNKWGVLDANATPRTREQFRFRR